MEATASPLVCAPSQTRRLLRDIAGPVSQAARASHEPAAILLIVAANRRQAVRQRWHWLLARPPTTVVLWLVPRPLHGQRHRPTAGAVASRSTIGPYRPSRKDMGPRQKSENDHPEACETLIRAASTSRIRQESCPVRQAREVGVLGREDGGEQQRYPSAGPLATDAPRGPSSRARHARREWAASRFGHTGLSSGRYETAAS